MRIDLCRRCGQKLVTHTKCNICNVPTVFYCSSCHVETDEQFHYDCAAISFDYTLLRISGMQ